ncbi:MAG TPA: hypothetical protein VH392_07730 [Sphingomicrobium sp.]
MNGRNRPPEWPIVEDQEPEVEAERSPSVRETEVVGGRRSTSSGLSWTTIVLIVALLLLVLLVAYLLTGRNPDQDKLTQGEAAGNATQPADPGKLCASRSTYDLIKRELFKRAAQVRGSDQATFDQLAGYASLRMENPVMESQDNSTHAVNCSGSLSLDLPPGVAIVGSRRTLTADIDYTVQPAADGSGNVVLLRNADPIITPLATLARANQPQTAPAPVTEEASPQQPQPDVGASESANKEVGPQTSYPGRPSFDCSKARTKGEIAVCNDSGLASLDVNMATQYQRAMKYGSAEQQALLQRTRDRFIAYRDRCPDTHCAAEAYLGRMREIRDIMEGRWQAPR